jgi:2-dehydropantoate 2-reductase
LIAGTGVRDSMREVVEETLAVAKAGGVSMAPGMLDRVYKIAEAMPTQFSSTAQDLARRKPTEIDHLNGFIVRRGAELGIATPVNQTLFALVKLVEAGRTPG